MTILETVSIAGSVAAAGLFLLLWRRAEARVASRGRGPSETPSKRSSPDENEAMEALFEGCGAGVIWVDADQVVQRSNSLARNWLAVREAEIDGRPLIQAALSADLAALVKQTLLEGRPKSGEMQSGRAAGRVLQVEALPLGSPSEAPLGAVVVIHDLTDIRRLETVRRDFVANVSHELRTPLASIRAMAETLQDGALNDPEVSTRFLGTIVSEADRLTRIAEDLLILTKAESRRPELAKVNLTALLEAVARTFGPRCDQAGLGFVCDVQPNLTVVSNQDQMEQALVNLVDNAIKYTPPGGEVRLCARKEEGAVLVEVADNGIGILQEDQGRVFERFYRVDKARSRQSGGTGLGLSIVKHIVESHGGQVGVESQLNRGSTFSIRLRESN